MLEAATNIKNGVEATLNKKLEPKWVESCLTPAKARKELDAQLEIPLFDID